MPVIRVEVNHQSLRQSIKTSLVKAAITAILRGEGVSSAEISVAIVDDQTIRRLNRQYLGHDHPTDVLSFPLERHAEYVEGEVIVSAQTADRQSSHYGWAAGEELLLYLIHGTLHLLDYDDQSPAAAEVMRAKEREYLTLLGQDASCVDGARAGQGKRQTRAGPPKHGGPT